MAVAAHSVLSYEEILRALNLPASSVGADKDAVEALALVVTIGMEREFGRRFVYRVPTNGTAALAEYIEYHTFRDPGSQLWLIERPILNLVEVKESSTRDWTNVAALTDNRDFMADKAQGMLERLTSGFSKDLLGGQQEWWPSGYVSPGMAAGPTWAVGARAVRVRYTAGYANTAAVPAHIKDVAGRLAALKWREVKRAAQGVSSVQDEAGNWTRFGPATLTKEMKQELRHEYRKAMSTTASRDWTAA